MSSITISNPKLYNHNDRLKFQAPHKSTLEKELASKVAPYVQKVFQARKLTGEFSFSANKKGITIIKKDGSETTLDGTKDAAQDILDACQTIWETRHAASGTSDPVDPSPAKPSRFALTADDLKPYAALHSETPKSRLSDRKAASPAAGSLPAATGTAVPGVSKLTGHVVAAPAGKGGKKRQITDLTNQVAALTNQKDAALVQVQDANQRIADLGRGHAAALAGVQQNLADATRDRDAALVQVQDANQRVTDLGRGHAAALAGVQQNLADATRGRDAALVQVQDANQRIADLGRGHAAVLAGVQQNLADATRDRDAARVQVQAADQRIADLGRDHAAALDQLALTADGILTEKTNLSFQFDQARRSIEGINGQLAGAEREIAELNRNHAPLHAEINRLTTQLQSLQEDYETMIAGLDDASQKEKERLQTEIDQAKNTLRNREAELQENARQIAALARDAAQAQVQDTHQRIADLGRGHAAALEQLALIADGILTEKTNLSFQFDQARRLIEGINGQLADAEREIAELNRNHAPLHAEINRLTTQLQSLQEDYETTIADLDDASQKEKERLQTEIDQAKNILRNREAALQENARQIAALAGELASAKDQIAQVERAAAEEKEIIAMPEQDDAQFSNFMERTQNAIETLGKKKTEAAQRIAAIEQENAECRDLLKKAVTAIETLGKKAKDATDALEQERMQARLKEQAPASLLGRIAAHPVAKDPLIRTATAVGLTAVAALSWFMQHSAATARPFFRPS